MVSFNQNHACTNLRWRRILGDNLSFSLWPNLGNGFLKSVTAAVWPSRPPEERLPPPKDESDSKSKTNSSSDSSKNAVAVSDPQTSVQNTPPDTVKIDDSDSKKAVGREMSSRVFKDEIRAPEGAKSKKPTHIKRLSSAGRQIDSVLERKTDNIKDHYTLGRKLGQGQFGTTFLCVEKSTGKDFACKSISKRKFMNREDVEDVRREIHIMHHLAGHSNVIQIVGAFEDAIAVHVVMELCAGGELFDRIIQRGHYSERKAAQLARTIVSVVEACHSLGVMHRDLKPENFLFVSQEEESALKTIDFGLSMFFRPGN